MVPTLKSNRELKIADIPRIECHGQTNSTDPERVTSAIDKRENYDNPASNPINSYWLHHRPKVSPSVQRTESTSKPIGVHFHPPQGDPYPMRDTTSESDDHNWWQRNSANRTNEAVFEGNWQHPEEHGEHDIYINNRRPHNKSVDAQTSKKTDSHQIVNKMDHSINNRFRAIHLSKWIPIRDKPDEKTPDRSPLRRSHAISERPIPTRAVATEAPDDNFARRITIDYGATRRTLFLGSKATGSSDEED